MGMERFIGIDLAWAHSGTRTRLNETGVAAIDRRGVVIDCGWTRGLEETMAWLSKTAVAGSTLAFVDAPLVVDNPVGQRPCERDVGQRYGRWKVSANSTNLSSPRLAGVLLREGLQESGWSYDDGRFGPPTGGLVVSESYPYTTLVGAAELGYDRERPRYKRQGRKPPMGWRATRALVCDQLIARLAGLADAEPPLLLASHPVSRQLLTEPSPERDADYKHHEDLIDALLCAWTAALWSWHGLARCQVLGGDAPAEPGRAPTISAPARPEQRRPSTMNGSPPSNPGSGG
jgi:predicted RNase H-like nuclease